MTKDEYRARIADIAEREEGARLYLAMKVADEAFDQAYQNDRFESPEVSAGIDELNCERRRRQQELDVWYDAEYTRIAGPDPMANARNAADAALTAYHDAPGSAIAEDDDGGVMRCALSGVPLYDDDDTITIGEATVLAALFVPGDVIAELRDDGEDDIEESA